ncbi:MAG TPA: 2OG-Fe(II) oxygenase [Planctomycetota bacterium]|nr:2OG-Fe(II) oxygenase [Planctomycetota bacterium]
MRAAAAEPGEVWVRGRIVRSKLKRHVGVLNVSRETRAWIESAFVKLAPRLANHFRRTLRDLEPVQFLRYREGGRYPLHTDRVPGTRNRHVRRRKVSVVVFLSRPGPGGGRHLGGELVFPGAASRGARTKFAFAVQAEPGLLVAFEPEVEHEVLPVRQGTRFSLAAWYSG